FAPNVLTTITLTGGPLVLTHNVTINGPGAGQVAVSGGNATTVFKVNSNVIAEIDGLTITGGNATVASGSPAGGGISNAGNLTLQNDVITDNVSAHDGGGLFNSSTGIVHITDCTLSDNSAVFGGGFFNLGTVTVSASTLSNNSAVLSPGSPNTDG